MSLRLHIDCGSTEGLLNLLKLVVKDSSCADYLTCANKDESIESIIKRLIVETDDGLAVAVCLGAQDLLNLTPQADFPAAPTEGMIIAKTDHHLYYYNGSTWKQLD